MAKHKVGKATIEALVDAMYTSMNHSIGCFICYATEEGEDVSALSFAKELYQAGWRIINSEKFQTIGAACPECVAKPDEERGE